MNVFCAVSQDKVVGPFFFEGNNITKNNLCFKTGYSLHCKQIQMTLFFNKMEHRPVGIRKFMLIYYSRS